MEIKVRNVNDAFVQLKYFGNNNLLWRSMPTADMLAALEYHEPVITQYVAPNERVLFDPISDTNPFFNFFESLWSLDGRQDSAYLKLFNRTFEFSEPFIAGALGHRMRHWPLCGEDTERNEFDQLSSVIRKLRNNATTQQAVISFWDPQIDLTTNNPSVPNFDTASFKVRDGSVEMLVTSRRSDALLDMYGTGTARFGLIHEFIAHASGYELGNLTICCDSLYVRNSELWQRVKDDANTRLNLYKSRQVEAFALFIDSNSWQEWLLDLRRFNQYIVEKFTMNTYNSKFTFFTNVAAPIYRAWTIWNGSSSSDPIARVERASYLLENECFASDWRRACIEWLERRINNATVAMEIRKV